MFYLFEGKRSRFRTDVTNYSVLGCGIGTVGAGESFKKVG